MTNNRIKGWQTELLTLLSALSEPLLWPSHPWSSQLSVPATAPPPRSLLLRRIGVYSRQSTPVQEVERGGLREMRDHGRASKGENRITIALWLLSDLEERVWGLWSQELGLSGKLLSCWRWCTEYWNWFVRPLQASKFLERTGNVEANYASLRPDRLLVNRETRCSQLDSDST